MNKQAHVFISGFVQGVGFRQFIKRNALKLGIHGWVKNLPEGPDGKVEAVFQGSKENIDKMIEFCKKGSFLSEIEDVSVLWEELDEEYQSFEVVF